MQYSGLTNSDQIKQELGKLIKRKISDQKLTQRAAAAKIRIPKGKISGLSSESVHGISLEKLLGALELLGEPVSFSVGGDQSSPKEAPSGVVYETDRQRYERIHGLEPIPKKYLSDFTIHLADNLDVKISRHPGEWKKFSHKFYNPCGLLSHSPFPEDISEEVRAIIYSVFAKNASGTGWDRDKDAFHFYQRRTFSENPSLPLLMKEALTTADKVIAAFFRDTIRHQMQLSAFERQRDEEEVSYLSYGAETMDIAQEFPSLISDNVLSLRPTIPDTWIPPLRAGLQQIEALRKASGSVCRLSDVKEKYGQLSILFSCNDPQIIAAIEVMEIDIPSQENERKM